MPQLMRKKPYQLCRRQSILQGSLREKLQNHDHIDHLAALRQEIILIFIINLNYMSGISAQQRAQLQKRIPKAIFLQNVEETCKEGADTILSLLDQQYNRYRLAEGQLLRAHQSMTTKIPEIEKTVQMIQCLASKPNMDVDFLISEGIFVRGKAKEPLEHVSLWLGANTIVELTFDEASDLLRANLANAESSLSQITEELAYIKDQKTTTEVNVARVYNYSLALKRQQQIARSKQQ